MKKFFTVISLCLLFTGCGGSGSATPGTTSGVDITDLIFSARDSSCADYINDYFSNVIDAQTLRPSRVT